MNKQSVNTVLNEFAIEEVKVGLLTGAVALKEAEKAIIEVVMERTRWNQLRAAREMGLSRGCFRTRLIDLFGDKYIGRGKPNKTSQ